MQNITRKQFVSAASMAAVGSAVASVVPYANAEGRAWDAEADVVVLGAGGAGLMACVGAVESGATAILLEKNGYVGGDSLVCHQDLLGFWPERAAADRGDGVEDVYEDYLNDWKATHEFSSLKGIAGTPLEDELPITERYLEIFPPMAAWVEEHGITLVPAFSGGSLATAYTYEPRMWEVSGDPLVVSVAEILEQNDAYELRLNAQAFDLVQDEDGSVVGVRYMDTKTGEVLSVKANKGVVISTGTFCANNFMVSQYVSYTYSLLPTASCASNTGDGHLMAMRAGAATRDMDLGLEWMCFWEGDDNYWDCHGHLAMFGAGETSPAPVDPAICINREGKRYVNEHLGYNGIGRETANSTARTGYYIVDSTVPPEDLLATDAIVVTAQTLEELADKLCIPAGAFIEEVARYNGFVDAGDDEDFGKDIEFCTRIEQPPFYALTVYPHPYVSLGGLATDADSRVLDRDGAAIPGLFAAGVVCGCYAEQEGLLYYGGFGQACAFGMQAGRIAAQ